MAFEKITGLPEAADWPRRRKAKWLIRAAEDRFCDQLLHAHAHSLYGREVWSLSETQLDELAETMSTVLSYLDGQIASGRVVN